MFFHVEVQAVTVAVVAILVAFDVFAVGDCLYTRILLKQPMKIDDWLILPASVSTTP